MTVPTDAVLRVVASMLYPLGNIAQNVFYCQFANDGGSDDDSDVLDDLEVWIEAVYATLNSQVQASNILNEMRVYIYDAAGGDWDELGVGSPSDGFANASEMLPHGVAAITSIRSTDPDVSARKYWPGFGEDTCAASNLVGSALTALIAATEEWLDPFTGGSTGSLFTPGVWSPTQVAFLEFVTNYVINGFVGYQRRRKPGVGI